MNYCGILTNDIDIDKKPIFDKNSNLSYEELGKKIGKLVTEKQIAYGDSFGKSSKILEILYPNGIKVEEYKDFLAIIRVIDKLFRIANKKDAFGESTPEKSVAVSIELKMDLPKTKDKN